MAKIPYQKAHFLISASKFEQLPKDDGKELAVVGRSNVGKSSVLNCIFNQKNLARVSKTPGRTQLMNVFAFDDKTRVVDLPGYGYAKVPPKLRERWGRMIENYLKSRQSLIGLLLIMDIRHPMQPMDIQLLDFSKHYGIPVHILLNKSDKLSKSVMIQTFNQVKSSLTPSYDTVTVECFSALRGVGNVSLQKQLDKWYGNKL